MGEGNMKFSYVKQPWENHNEREMVCDSCNFTSNSVFWAQIHEMFHPKHETVEVW